MSNGKSLEVGAGAKATEELHEIIKRLAEESNRQTRHMIGLTYAIIVLTIMMLIAVIVQIRGAV